MTGPAAPLRLAMWSGPRNISTAMMRAWGNRADTEVIDEPFYAFYLQATGKKHPVADEVIAAGETDWRKLAARLTSAAPADKSIVYQKQMTHHLLPAVERSWLGSLTNCFLIRDPAEVIVSYLKKHDDPTAEDLGFPQQVEIYEWVRAHGMAAPPIIDARDVLQNPERILQQFCTAVGVQFDEAMLSWPPGLRETDGVWAKHWYAEVARSTSFQTYRSRPEVVPKRLRETYARCQECYEQLYPLRLH